MKKADSLGMQWAPSLGIQRAPSMGTQSAPSMGIQWSLQQSSAQESQVQQSSIRQSMDQLAESTAMTNKQLCHCGLEYLHSTSPYSPQRDTNSLHQRFRRDMMSWS